MAQMNIEEMFKQFVADLPVKTGRNLDEWRQEIRLNGPQKFQDRIAWLKAEHGLAYRPASMLAQHAGESGADYGDAAGLLAQMYAGPKSALMPIYERLMEIAMDLGNDVTAVNGKTQVTLRRRYVFALIKPTTNARVDLGLAFPAMPAHPRLVSTGGLEKGDRISYRLGISRLDEIDDEVIKLLRAAYDGTAG